MNFTTGLFVSLVIFFCSADTRNSGEFHHRSICFLVIFFFSADTRNSGEFHHRGTGGATELLGEQRQHPADANLPPPTAPDPQLRGPRQEFGPQPHGQPTQHVRGLQRLGHGPRRGPAHGAVLRQPSGVHGTTHVDNGTEFASQRECLQWRVRVDGDRVQQCHKILLAQHRGDVGPIGFNLAIT